MRSLIQLALYQFRGLYREKVAFFFNLIFPLLLARYLWLGLWALGRQGDL